MCAYKNYNSSEISEQVDQARHLIKQLSENLVIAEIREGKIIRRWFGENIAKISGYSVEELENDTSLWPNIMHPSDRQRLEKTFSKLAYGEACCAEYRIFRKDGQMRWISEAAAPSPVRDETANEVVSLITEATTKQPTLDQLMISHDVLDQAPSAVAVIELTNRLVYCNNACVQMLGYDSPDDLATSQFEELISSPYQQKFATELMPKIINDRWIGEIEMQTASGGTIHVRINTNPLKDAEGKPAAIWITMTDITDRYMHEEALRERDALLESVQNAFTANLAVLDQDGNIISVNEPWRKFARENGDPSLEHTGVGVNYLDVCRRAKGKYSDEAFAALEGLQRILNGELESFELEYPCPTKGEVRWFSMRAAPLTGKRKGLVVSHIEITELKNTQNALEAREALLRQFVEHTPAAIAMFDREMRYIVASERWLTDYRLSGKDIIGKTHYEVFPEVPERWKEIHKRVLNGSIERCEEDSFIRANGTTDWVRWELRPWYDANGEIGGVIMFTEVITERKKAENALKESEEKYRTLVEGIDAIFFRITPDFKPVVLFGQVEKLSGYSKEEILATPSLWIERIHPDDLQEIKKARAQMAQGGKPENRKLRIRHKDGSIRWVREYVRPSYDQHGNISHFDGVAVEITEQVEAQQREAKHMAHMNMLAEMSQLFASSLDYDGIINATTDKVSKFLNGTCAVLSLDTNTKRVHAISAKNPNQRRADEIIETAEKMELTLFDTYGYEAAKPRLVSNVEELSPRAAQLAKTLGLGSGIVTPLIVADHKQYVLTVVRDRDEETFDEEDLWLLTEVAAHAAAGLQSAQSYRRQARIAETLQRSLIPKSPSIPRFDIATCYRPARGESEVGGDFYDILDFGDGKIGIMIGDVSGKGMEAAIHTAETKYMLRGFAAHNRNPVNVISAVNYALSTYIGKYSFVTLFYGLLNFPQRTLTYVNAGHETPLITCTTSRNLVELQTCGPALGVVKDVKYDFYSLPFEIDDCLLLYTDGITEAPRDGERFGYNRLKETVEGVFANSASELLYTVLNAVESFSGDLQHDDQVVVVVRPTG